MMTELSLNILDIVQNSIRANANLIEISLKIDENSDLLTVTIKDNGNGMTKEELKKAGNPFYTTRTTRNIGLGISFFKLACEITGGFFSINSEKNVGTEVFASFKLSHIDRMPIGDITSTIYTLITTNIDLNFIYTYSFNLNSFTLDTREMRKTLGELPLNIPDVSLFIREYLDENKKEIDGGIVY